MIKTLTSFRFLAALMVFTWHVGWLTQYQFGYTGVSFFYVLSGFILTYNYQEKFQTLSKRNVVSFYLARFAKIYPIHMITFFISIPLVVYGSQMKQGHLIWKAITNIFLLQSFVPNFNFAFNGVSWSLSDEMFFYLLFPFILGLIAVFRHRLTALKIVLIISVVWVVFLALAIPQHVGLDYWAFYTFPPVRIIDFVIGVLLGTLFMSRNRLEWRGGGWTLVELSSIVFLIAGILVSPYMPQSIRFSALYIPEWSFLVYIFAFQRGAISKLLSNRIFTFLGDSSFSFYMTHQLVIRVTHHLPGMHSHLVATIVSLVISICVSGAMYLFYEEPLRKKIRYGLGKKLLPAREVAVQSASA